MQRKILMERIKSSLQADWSLTEEEANSRTILYGNNDIIEKRNQKWLEILKETAQDPMIWFLLATGGLFGLLKNYQQMLILFLATIPLIIMDGVLHWRTLISTRTLQSGLATFANVIRQGQSLRIAVSGIVPGDLIEVTAGNYFPADGIIVQGDNLQADESTLTGESFPAIKSIIASSLIGNEPLVDSKHWGFAGTRLLTGKALLRIVYTGQETLYGQIINSAQQTLHEKTPLQKTIAKLVSWLIVIASIFCIVLGIVRLYQGFGFFDAILSAATLGVAALPDEFPVVFTFFLGLGVYKLARKKALVRRAVSVENIGRITCICSDKTGTITEGKFQLMDVVVAENIEKENLIYNAWAASRRETGDPLDIGIHAAAKAYQFPDLEKKTLFPFTETRKKETAIIQHSSGTFLAVCKGSPETLLAMSELSPEKQTQWQKQIDGFAAQGYKVIACAQKWLADSEEWSQEPVSGYQFIGLLLFADPPREGVANAIQQCLQAKIRVLMLTGDHPETARSIAKKIGLGGGNPQVILADELEKLDSADVIARAMPSQKLDIVKTLQSAHEIVAVTGDGVNDVPAIKKADIGIAMGERGTQSAREIADIVLLDDNFNSIVNAIAEGRQLFKNLQASFKYLLMIHAPFIFSAAIIPLMGYPLLYYPIHIVWIELFIHPTSMLVFQESAADKQLLPVERRKIYFFNQLDFRQLISISLFTTATVIFTYLYLQHHSVNDLQARSVTMGLLSFFSAGITAGLNGLRSMTGKIIVSATVILPIIFIQIPFFADFFSLSPLSILHWSLIAVCGLLTFFLARK